MAIFSGISFSSYKKPRRVSAVPLFRGTSAFSPKPQVLKSSGVKRFCSKREISGGHYKKKSIFTEYPEYFAVSMENALSPEYILQV
jgi:hypothetical protein